MSDISERVTIEKPLKFDDMRNITNSLQLDFNEIFCGYGRQDRGYIDGIVYEDCCLNNYTQCSRVPTKGWKNEYCPIYKKIILGEK